MTRPTWRLAAHILVLVCLALGALPVIYVALASAVLLGTYAFYASLAFAFALLDGA